MKNQELVASGRTVSKVFDMADIFEELHSKIEVVKQARVKMVRSYFRKMRRKASLRSQPIQPSKYTDSKINDQI